MKLHMPSFLLTWAFLAATSSVSLSVPVREISNDNEIPTNMSTYDFVVVGGGTAGLTLASRLSENPSFQVLLIEAGPFPDAVNSNESIPGLDLVTLAPSNLDWNISTTPQSTLDNRTIHYTHGKCIGGSSVLNFMIYTRGSVSLYDRWEALGNPGWGWQDVQKYFLRSTHFTPNTGNQVSGDPKIQDTFNASVYSPEGGPLQLSFNRYKQEIDPYLVDGLKEIGLPRIDDFNDGEIVGVAPVVSTIDPQGGKGTRSSSYAAFYGDDVRKRTNLHIWAGTRAKRVLIRGEGQNKTAYGVEYMSDADIEGGEVGTALVTKEVILSAGSLHTTQLLLLSGVGPASTLEEFNIPPVVHNEDVGKHLQDHATFYISVEVPSDVPTMDLILRNKTAFQSALGVYQAGQGGQLDTANTDFLGFQRLTDVKLQSIGADELIELGEDWPNLEYLIAPEYLNPGFPQPPNATGNYITITVVLLTPTSAGEVRITSGDVRDPLLVDVQYLTTEVDRKQALLGFQYGMKLAHSSAFKPIFLGDDRIFPTPDSVDTDEKVLEYIKQSMGTIWHASGTAGMGRVVDSELAVYGVEGLRVADASVQPVLSNAHIQATVYMIAEKAADIIKSKYGM